MTDLIPMPEIERPSDGDDRIDEAELAAAAFLARSQGRTLDAYRYDLRVSEACSADIDNQASSRATEPCASSARATNPP